jgi:hypothetical protein
MPPNMQALIQRFQNKNYLFTNHGSDQAAMRGISSNEIEHAIINGQVIEDYPADKYGASCLIMGKTSTGRVLHVQINYPTTVKIITVYEPSPNEWEPDWKTRKK